VKTDGKLDVNYSIPIVTWFYDHAYIPLPSPPRTQSRTRKTTHNPISPPRKNQLIARAPLTPKQKPHPTIPHLPLQKKGNKTPNNNNNIIEPNSMHSLGYISPPSPLISESSTKWEQAPNRIPKNYSHHKQRVNSYRTYSTKTTLDLNRNMREECRGCSYG